MGEIAEMMLGGMMCECCGEYIFNENGDIEDVGFPQYCSTYCANSRGATWSPLYKKKAKAKKKKKKK